jgi:hypothetical protein
MRLENAVRAGRSIRALVLIIRLPNPVSAVLAVRGIGAFDF